jgi:hypothetical protein
VRTIEELVELAEGGVRRRRIRALLGRPGRGRAAAEPRLRGGRRTGGYGPDHEPLIGSVQPIAWIGGRATKQAHELYEERFGVERDSTRQRS